MKTQDLVEVWDQKDGPYMDGSSTRTIGVNWSAVGPVTPATARRFARRVLAMADKAEERAGRAKVKLISPEKS